jgi:PAS domain S-box-containing protein
MMRFRLNPQLAVQLVAATLLPILMVSGALSVSMIQGRREQLIEQARLRAQQAGQTAVAIYSDRIAFAQLLAGLLSERLVLTQRLSVGNTASLQAFVQQTRNDTLFDLVTITDANGTILAQDGRHNLWRPGYAVTEPLTFWGIPNIGLVVQTSAPIDQAGAPPGRFVGSFVIDAAFLTGLRAQTSLDKSILFGDQLVASSLASREPQGSGFLQADVAGQILRGDSPVVIETVVGNAAYLAHYMPIHRPGGQVLGAVEVLLPLAPVYAAQRQATATLLVTTLLAALAATLLGWFLARRLGQPIRQLAWAADALGNDLTQAVQVRGPREIQMLSESIEQMRQRLYATHAALQAEKARYANILESVEEGVVTLDLGGRVTSLNQSAEAMLGVDRESAHGMALAQLVPLQRDTALTLDDIPPASVLSLAIRTHDGRQLTVAATRSQVHTSTDRAPGEHIVVLRDISEEAAVRQLKEAFLANITHEFRTPLSALIASLEILREDSEGLTPTERQQMLMAVHLGVQRLDTLVQNLLDSASLQAGYFRVDPDVTRLTPLIEEAVEMMRPLVQQRGQTVDVALPAELPPVIADDRRIVQVLVNLLSNATKFGPRGDSLQVIAQVRPSDVYVAITDHGPGIAPSRQAHLFERFVRPGAETIRAQGVGLGLAIVKAIVERHGGQAIVEASGGGGTTFAFTLPRAPDPLVADYPDLSLDANTVGTLALEHEVHNESAAGR